ncbi:MAG: insulinase family protein [Treponema sp.]|nr:insulinase family protein [Candidatus Treponema merdequi]
MTFSAGCKSSGLEKATAITLDRYETLEDEPFYSQNYNSFFEKKLSNGIPVIIKKSVNQKSAGFRILIESDENSTNIKKNGLEEITLELMKHGSKKYSELYISSLEYTDQAVFTYSTKNDWCEYGFTCPKEKIKSVLEVFAESFLIPALDEEKFNEILEEKEKILQYEEISPNYCLLKDVYMELSKSDIYFAPKRYTARSEIFYSDVKKCHEAFLNGRRLKIIATGNFNDDEVKSLYSQITEDFESIASYRFSKKYPKYDSVDFASMTEKVRYTKSDFFNTSHVLGVFNIPRPCSDEYLKYALLSLYLDDMFYSELKEKSNMVQDIGTGNIMGYANLGIISVYNVLSLKNMSREVYDYVIENLKIEQSQKKIDNYKRIYTSFVLSSELSVSKTLDQMASSLIYCGDAKEYIMRPYKISKITAEDFMLSFEATIGKGVLWFMTNF